MSVVDVTRVGEHGQVSHFLSRKEENNSINLNHYYQSCINWFCNKNILNPETEKHIPKTIYGAKVIVLSKPVFQNSISYKRLLVREE